jgi:plasmid replication initiation protein
MVGELSQSAGFEGGVEAPRSPLLPDRHPTADLFVCDIFDAAPKGDMASMAHPIFSLSTKPDRRTRRYESGTNYLEVRPSADGLATIHDRDVLIYCISQVMAALNEGRKVSQTIRLRGYDLLKATNRMTNGQGYEGLKAALNRLQGTQIETNIVTGGVEQIDIFSIIDRARIVRETRDGRMQEVEITLSDWVFNAIEHQEVLTLHRDYFRLRKPLERRMYELARKHCGRQAEWTISLDLLQKKCGSSSTLREFRRLVRAIADQDRRHAHMPDYAVLLDGEDRVIFRNRQCMPPALAEIVQDDIPPLPGDVYHDARAEAPGWDVRYLEQEWRRWCAKEEIAPKRPDAHFLKFCRSWYDKRGAPR